MTRTERTARCISMLHRIGLVMESMPSHPLQSLHRRTVMGNVRSYLVVAQFLTEISYEIIEKKGQPRSRPRNLEVNRQ